MDNLARIAAELQRLAKELEGEAQRIQDELKNWENSITPSISAEKDARIRRSHILQNYFLSTYKRDKLKVCDEEDERFIAEGKKALEEGACSCPGHKDDCPAAGIRDCWVLNCTCYDFAYSDADLYNIDVRGDHWVFESLYGVHPSALESEEDYYRATSEALDKHAKDVADPGKSTSEAYATAFDTFIKLLKEHDYPRHWRDNSNSPVLKAYRVFEEMRRTEVTEIRRF